MLRFTTARGMQRRWWVACHWGSPARCPVAAAVRVPLRLASGDAAAPATGAARPAKVKVTFVDGKKKTNQTLVCEAPIGQTLLGVALSNRVDIEAACDGTCACSTCHVYVDEAHFTLLPKISDDEEDMLDLALARRPVSRLACQLTVTEAFDGIELHLPAEVSSQLAS